jgi:Cell wall-active antibiotics response LiaF, C-terminal
MELETNQRDTDDRERAAPTATQATRRRFIVSVFGDITRTGPWPARRRISPVAVFGDIDLDLRQATTEAGELAINAVAPFGNIDVLVPEGVEVDVGGFTLFGTKKISVKEVPPDTPAPVVRVHGFTLFGSVKVWRP